MILSAPWTDGQVKNLNAWQERLDVHPYTCGSRTEQGEAHILRATTNGWVCDECRKNGTGYSQAWCHDFSAKGPSI